MSENVNYFSKNVHYLRQVHNLTQKEMAKIMGISVGCLRKIEKGTIPPRASCSMLIYVCNYFDLSADEIVREDLTDSNKL